MRSDGRPTIHLTNWPSRRLHSGTAYTIMARPRHWERGAGTVLALVPDAADLAAVRSGAMSMKEYRRRFIDGLEPGLLVPGELRTPSVVVRDGDTLCCGCARAAAAEGRCHRVWAAEALRAAGWRVVLDGEVR